MHIVYETSEFVTEEKYGGLAAYLDNISEIMCKQGHKITIITLANRNGIIRYRKNLNVIRVKRKECYNQDNQIACAINMIVNSWKIRRALNELEEREKIDLIQAANYRAVGLFRSRRIPTVVRASSDSSMWRNAAQKNFDYNKSLKEKTWEDLLELWCVKHADVAIAPSDFCAKVLSKRSGIKVHTLESPYPEKDIELDDSLYLKVLKDKTYLLFHSSMSYLKGTHIAIEAIDTLMEKYPDLHLVFVGNDHGLKFPNGGSQSITHILKRKNKVYDGRVLYLGVLKHKDLFPIVQHACACVLPSRVDNLPNACIEAMAMGRIVIGTYGASFEQLITNKENGLLIRRDSVRSLLGAIEYLLKMSEQDKRCMEEKAALAVDRLNPQRVYEELMKVYKYAIEIHKRKR